MHLRVVELRDWRSYRHARFELPVPKGRRNVVLIRGPNEHGKTSFFEAITLGMFGRDGLFLIPRARVATGGDLEERQAVTYSQFLGGSLHRRAIAQGRQSCSVTLEFEDDEGEPIVLTRSLSDFCIGGRRCLSAGDADELRAGTIESVQSRDHRDEPICSS